MGVVRRLERGPDGGELSVRAQNGARRHQIGDSIAVSGACLTVVALDGDGFMVDCMPETLVARPLWARRGPGALVNLERSLAWAAGWAAIWCWATWTPWRRCSAVERRGHRLGGALLAAGGGARAAVAAKGSIAIDGISLTVMRVDGESVRSGHHPAHPARRPPCGRSRPGMRVNLEADVLARYVLQSLQTLAMAGTGAGGIGALRRRAGLTEEFLREQGFA